jgi:protein-tyrosine-phosphatase
MAEALFRKALAGRDDIAVGSAGVAAAKGAPASRETIAAVAKRGAEFKGFASRPVTESLLSRATHVFAMTEGHLAVLESRFPEHAAKFFLVGEFSGITDKRQGVDVPDPIGMGVKAYEEVAQVLESAIPAIISYIDKVG